MAGRLARHCYNGKDLKVINNAKKAIAALQSMDARNDAYNSTHEGLKKIMFFSGPILAKALAVVARCDSAIMQVYAIPTPE